MFLSENFLAFEIGGIGFLLKAFLVLFLIFYAIFSLVLFRQVQLMEKSLPLPLSPVLTFVAILQIGIAMALIFIVIGAF